MVFTYKKTLSVTLIVSAIVLAAHAFAQTPVSVDVPDDLANDTAQYDSGPSENDIIVDFSPENPGAFQNVTLRTRSDYIDLNRYNSSWFVDGKKVVDGIGARTAIVKTRGYGQRTTVIILIQLPDTLIKKTVSFEPQDMTLLWEAADSYVPPFYQGKKLVSREGVVKVVAIPNFKDGKGSNFNPGTGVYRWSRNGNVVGTATGYAKDSFLFKNNKIRSSEEVSVTASDTSGSHQATQGITIQTYNPKILFYERNIATGITEPFPKTSLSLSAASTAIVAEPYFFSVLQGNPNSVTFRWTMNDAPVVLSDANNQKTITLQNPGGDGSAILGLGIINSNSVFQKAVSKLSIVINKN